MQVYREKKNLQSLLAVCFTESNESYHHWRVFADGPSGVSITFNGPELIEAVEKRRGVRSGRIRYLTLEQMEKNPNPLAVRNLPFRKRWAFLHESEHRIIYESDTKTASSLDIAVPLSCIERVTLSPWLPEALKPVVISRIRSIRDCASLKVVRSTLISNDKWKSYGDAAIDDRKKS